MRFPKIFCFAVLVTVGASRAGAQTVASPTPLPTPRPSPPAPPFLNQTPDFSAWSIGRYNIPGLGGQSAAEVVRSAASVSKPESVTSVVKTGEVRHQTGEVRRPTGQVRHQLRKLKSGEQEDVWYEHGNRVTMESMWKIPLFEGETSGAKSPQGPDFPELSWISAANFVGTQEYQSVSYLIFETGVTEGSATLAKDYGYKLESTFNRAYINADTRLPWMHQIGDVLQRYVFQAAPTTPLEVPPEYQALFDAYERKKIEAARKPIAP